MHRIGRGLRGLGLTIATLWLLQAAALASTQSDQAFEAYRQSDFNKVIELCNTALADPALDDIKKAGFMHLRGAARLRLGDYAGAIADYDATLAFDLGDLRAGVLWERGLTRMLSGDCPEAIKDYDAAIAARSDDGEYFADRARCRSRMGDRSGAIADVEHALQIRPGVQEWIDLLSAVRGE